MDNDDAVIARHARPIATVYQNSDQIAGILQQLFNSPLALTSSQESTDQVADGLEGSAQAEGSLQVKAKALPAILGLDGGGKMSGTFAGSSSQTTARVSQQQFAYTQAYNLHLALDALIERNHIKELGDHVTVGDFVQYEASFDPAELTILLDVLTPELVGAIAKFATERSFSSTLSDAPSRSEVESAAARMQVQAAARQTFAAEIARGFRSDSRQSTTREYYARVAEKTTAVTVCELQHFIVEDPDRLLDGRFTVLGKVLTDVEDDAPTFSRNKLLRNVSPDALDVVIDKLQSSLAGSKLGGSSASLLDWKLTSRIAGRSWRVLPLAIFV